MSNKVLFVFEGEKTEEQIVSNLQTFFLDPDITVSCVYGAEIYQIYEDIKTDKDLDTFNLIKERNIKNNDFLESYNRNDFAEIYLFFDYDGHSTLADDNKLSQLIDFFNEETEKGKLYVSYPMVEALKHICDYETFENVTVECKKNIRYKHLVHNSAINELSDFKKYNLNIWKIVITLHLKKANFITNDIFIFPNELISQDIIFSNQFNKYIQPRSQVAVLSSFPIFLHDYYGNKKIKNLIE